MTTNLLGRRSDATRTKLHSSTRPQNQAALDHASRIIHRVCCLAGPPDFIDQIVAETSNIRPAIASHDTPTLFEWFVRILSYQGISDQVARNYIEDHGSVTWAEVERGLATRAPCPKLEGYWRFHDCRYHKSSCTCSEPEHIDGCPLPAHNLRNGRLNQMAYSLYFFIRDVADGDFVQWVDRQLAAVALPHDADRLRRMREALCEPLRNVYGISDKVLNMVFATLLMAVPRKGTLWFDVGVDMVAIDTLVHNFMHRTGVLRRLGADHLFGPICYQPGQCADIIRTIASRLDAREFNPRFPTTFPRFVQSAIWRYCAEDGLDICNGNRIDDGNRCQYRHCQARVLCDRVTLQKQAENA